MLKRLLHSLLVFLFLSMMSSSMTIAKDFDTRRILITGFYDWRDLGTPPQQTRCRDNPSCRILAKEGLGERGYLGPLAQQLKDWKETYKPQLKLEFALLPVTWEALGSIPRGEFDVIIHLGLGVYDSFHRILVEDGAYNFRQGKDAIGVSRKEKIEAQAPTVLEAPSQVSKGIDRALSTELAPPFKLVRATARKDNVYLCNSTYYEALQSLEISSYNMKNSHSIKKEAYFLHLPHREGDSDIALANAVFTVIKALID